ncbi:MAG: hypothetical protein JSW04_12480 [Desulfobacterales bacterium]|nr:MAG: hypothetical protein JSW04_12480 [Desulfobacterales bacterium]
MDTGYFRKIAIFLSLLMVWGILARPHRVMSSGPCGELTNQIGHGGILWTEKAIIVQGTAVPDVSDPNQSLHIIKEKAKRAATIDAYRKAAGILAGIRLTSDSLAGDHPSVISKINAYVRKATICKSKFYADGGVDVVVRLPITGAFAMDQFRNAGTDPAMGTSMFTGLIVDASHLVFAPALVPRLLRTDGTVIFSAAKVRTEVVLQGTAVHYVGNSAAIDNDIVGINPLKIKALGMGAVSPSDLIIDAKAASILDGSPEFMSSGRIVIITGKRRKIVCKDIADTVQDTKIDWKHRIILARGNGRTNFQRELDNSVRMRMMEQAADVDAQRKLLMTALQIKIDGKTTVEDSQGSVAKINGAIVNAVRCEAKFFRDGSSEVVLAAPIDGLAASGKGMGKTGQVRIVNETDIKTTGLIIDATGHRTFVPVLEPMLVGPDGTVLYGTSVITRSWANQYGVAGYRSSLKEAKTDQRIGVNPYIITPTQVDEDNPARLMVGPADAAFLIELNVTSDLLSQGRIVIVTAL